MEEQVPRKRKGGKEKGNELKTTTTLFCFINPSYFE